MKTCSESLTTLARIAQNSHRYYELLDTRMVANSPDLEQMEHFHAFLHSLPEGLKAHFQRKGFEGTSKSILFRRFLLERTGNCMKAYLRERLDATEYALWQEQDSYQQELLQRLNQLG